MARAITARNLLEKKHETFQLDGEWEKVMGNPERSGLWLIYGKEKNGKTWFALLLALYFCLFEAVIYVSAEEGIGKAFKDSCIRAQLNPNKHKNIHFLEYEPIEDLKKRLKKRNAAKIVFLDNHTIYNEELKGQGLNNLKKEFPHVLFVGIAHEDRNEPATSSAKMCRKLAAIIMRVQGLTCTVSGRCPGGILSIDEEKAALYHGHQTNI